MAGPYWAYGLDVSAVDNDNNLKESFSFEEVGMARTDWGAALGGGVDVEIAKGRKMFIDYRYNVGLKDIALSSDIDTYNEGSSITMGIMVPLKKVKAREEH